MINGNDNVVVSKQDLLRRLEDQLRGKPVWKTLKAVRAGKATQWEAAKGLFSLGTHVAIELEQGREEYRAVLVDVYEQLGTILFSKDSKRKG
jgi:hypothetical protein